MTTDPNTNTNTKTSTNNNTKVTTSVTTDGNTGVTTTVIADPNLGTNTKVVTDPNGNVNSKTVVDTTNNVTTNVSLDTNTNTKVTITLNPEISQVTKVVEDPTTKVVISTETLTLDELTPGEQEKLTVDPPKPVEKEPIKTPQTTKTPKTTKTTTTPTTGGMLLGQAPAATSKVTMPEEAWLGGRFRTDFNPLAMFPFLFPTAEQREAESFSALRRASGVEPKIPERDEMDYWSYGKEPSIESVLEPYLNGGSVQKYAQGGIIMPSALQAAMGGVQHKGSHYVQGAGGGQDDLIPARLADGEYVFDAEIVAALGDGSNREGARRLDAMREAIRKHKRSGSLKKIPPAAKNPLAYFKEASK